MDEKVEWGEEGEEGDELLTPGVSAAEGYVHVTRATQNGPPVPPEPCMCQ